VKTSLLAFVLFATAASGQAPPAAAPKPQTPRQALLEMLFARDAKTFDRHLPAEARKKMAELGMLDSESRPTLFDAREMQYMKTFEEGPVLLVFEPPPRPYRSRPEPKQRIEITVDADDLRGDEAVLELGFHRYLDGVEQLGQLEPRFRVTMFLEKGVWKLGDLAVSAHLPLRDPTLLTEFEKEFAHERVSANESSAVGSLRVINVAQVSYQARSGRYTCVLESLGPNASGKEDATHAAYLDQKLASGSKGGYLFRLSDCGSGGAYRASAVPAQPGVTGARAFCTDDSGIIRASEEATADACFIHGKPLK